jgi:hypothetical protein
MVAIACTGTREPQPLSPADLTVSGVAIDDDTTSLRNRLGAPSAIDSVTWHYDGLGVVVSDGRVAILFLEDSTRWTARGLRVGDAATRFTQLYTPCFIDETFAQVCYPTEDFDERLLTARFANGRIVRLAMGRIAEP